MFRVIQECLTNIHRYSGSKRARIQVTRRKEDIILEIEDQGTGISPERLAEFRRRARDVGIRDLRERMRPFHGELDIESGSSGTKFRVAIPFRKMSSRRNLQPPRRFEPLASWHLRRILCGS